MWNLVLHNLNLEIHSTIQRDGAHGCGFLIPVGRKWERNWTIECFLKSAIVKRQAIRYNRFRQIKKETHNSEFLNPHLCGPRRAVWKVLYLNLVVLSHMVVN